MRKESIMSDGIRALIGKTLVCIDGVEGDEEIIFTAKSGEKYMMYHRQECSESVSVEDICGDTKDLLGSPILDAFEKTSNDNPDGVRMQYQDSFTWTFYTIVTARGAVTIRWYGESNGYYSESVEFELI